MAPDCFHCGTAVPAADAQRWSARIDGEARTMCCAGCAAVAQSIADAGLLDYYRNRTGPGLAAGAPAVPDELRLYDNTFEVEPGTPLAEAVLSVEGIRCAACVWMIERHLARLPGMQEALMNVATERLRVRFAHGSLKLSDILIALRNIGYVAYPYDVARHGEQLARERKKSFRQLFIAGLSMMQVMMYAFPVYVAESGTMDADMEGLMEWASLFLTLPAILYSAQPFFRGAWSNLKARMLGMDVPVALGIAAAFIGSVAATLSGRGDVYYDSVTMFIFLLLGSRHLELLARHRAAGSLEKLQRAQPASALRVPGYPGERQGVLVGAAELREGDVMLVRAGEAFAADAEVIEGQTSADMALLSGESRPQPLAVGDAVPGGAVNVAQAVYARVARASAESTLARLVQLVERAGQGKPAIAEWADKVAAWFVAALLALTVVVFLAWQVVDAERAWQVAVAVLVVSCPCALSLATPTALAAATDGLLRRGVLVVKPHVLETLERATHVVFDKTGTLTVGKPVVTKIKLSGGMDEARALRIAAALEEGSSHPVAQAIRSAAPAAASLAATDAKQVPGMGVEGTVDGVRYRLGSPVFAGGAAGADEGVVLSAGGQPLAHFLVEDAVRPESRDLVARFNAIGKQVVLLSGDSRVVTERVARELDIGSALGEQLPDQKLSFVKALQAQGHVVAMVGDGINDAAVLSAADVSFAMGSGTALAQMHADGVLLGGQVSLLADASRKARRTMAIVKQNLAWATLYNMVAIPAAAVGLLNPWMSGIGMSLSSAVVVLNALRLRRGA